MSVNQIADLAGKNRNEDDIINAQNDFERGQRQQADPDFRLCNPFHRADIPGKSAKKQILCERKQPVQSTFAQTVFK